MANADVFVTLSRLKIRLRVAGVQIVLVEVERPLEIEELFRDVVHFSLGCHLRVSVTFSLCCS